MKELELIRLYYYLCDCHKKCLWAHHQRFSPNACPRNQKLDDVELLTIYLYCRRYEQKHRKKDIYDYAHRYLHSWFPTLPNYANFTTRLNQLSSMMPYLVEYLLEELQASDNQTIEHGTSLLDSLPVMLCSGKRQGKVAPELSEKSYCATKKMYYFGVKIHVVAYRRKGTLPMPEYLLVSSGAENDLEAIRHLLPQLLDRHIFADKAYVDKQLAENLHQQANTQLLTPIKRKKGDTQATRQFKKAADDLFSTAVSTVRQPIESLFNWIIQKSDVQTASTVRNTPALILHIFGAIATALFFWRF